MVQRLGFLLLAALVTGACTAPNGDEAERAGSPSDRVEEQQVSDVVTQFGAKLKEVPLLAPDTVRARSVREAYGPLVSAELLERWLASPSEAPGRDVSSPWPERIEIHDVRRATREHYEVEGEVIYVTSVEAGTGGEAAREPVLLDVRKQGGAWRIHSYAPEKAAGTRAP